MRQAIRWSRSRSGLAGAQRGLGLGRQEDGPGEGKRDAEARASALRAAARSLFEDDVGIGAGGDQEAETPARRQRRIPSWPHSSLLGTRNGPSSQAIRWFSAPQ